MGMEMARVRITVLAIVIAAVAKAIMASTIDVVLAIMDTSTNDDNNNDDDASDSLMTSAVHQYSII